MRSSPRDAATVEPRSALVTAVYGRAVEMAGNVITKPGRNKSTAETSGASVSPDNKSHQAKAKATETEDIT